MIFNRARQGSLGGGGGGGGSAAYVDTGQALYLLSRTAFAAQVISSSSAFDAAADRVAFVGQVTIPGGGSKTISAAGGGSIVWGAGSPITFVDAGTTIRVGLQDLDASGDPDETFDVYTDLIGATDTITASTARTDVMSVGTKTITHGDYVAIVMRMHTRGGSDIVRVAHAYGIHADGTMNMGLVGNLLGGSWSSVVSSIASYINFDDGTQGFISGLPVMTGGGTVTYNVDTAVRDELGMFFRPPFACKTGGVALYNAYSAGSTFELCLYQNPLSATPTLLEAVPVDTALLLSNGNNLAIPFDTEHELLPANTYALTIRPTNTTNSVVAYYDMPTATAGLAEGLSADDWYAVSRVDNSGAFADWNNGVAKTRRMHLSLLITAIKASQT